MDEPWQRDAKAYAFTQLVAHLQMRTDVQNIEQMILAGFCRNCLSKWYYAGAVRAGVPLSYDDACELVYGMPYAEWKKSYQSKASDEQLRRLEETKAGHARHPPLDAPAPPPPPPPPRLLSDVCCEPVPPPPPLRVAQPAEVADVRLGILTVSDRASRGTYDDISGPEAHRCMLEYSGQPSTRWRLELVRKAVVPDDAAQISAALVEWSGACNLILTTGGTGLSPRDVTPDATLSVVDKPLPGITELLLRESIKLEPLAALSRAAAGTRGRTLIVNLPGRPKAVVENLRILMPLLAHALNELAKEA
ncbi:hypothetical protein AB1Y20_006178 [Prymnesium parvum]|uniref:molybdopterin molybdotransferase n=1 Tax=Prymnesium parvum TaxID=97485 RepID=A0AB34J1X6_PRYPA